MMNTINKIVKGVLMSLMVMGILLFIGSEILIWRNKKELIGQYLSKVESETQKKHGKPQTIIIGKDLSGEKRVIWTFSNRVRDYFNPISVDFVASLENSISKQEAVTIIVNNNLATNMKEEEVGSEIELDYVESSNDKIKRGAYWIVNNGQISGEQSIYIDIYTGQPTVINMN